jgi:DNA-binding NtrC family response regulator
MAKILVVDDEPGQRSIIRRILETKGHSILEADNVKSALQVAAEWHPNVVLTDLKMKNCSGLDIVKGVSSVDYAPEVVLMTAYGSVETAVNAMKSGAYDYLTKPIEKDVLLMVVERAAEKHLFKMDGVRIKEQEKKNLFEGFVSASEAMKSVFNTIEKVARTDATVLIRGESGTGKERVARLIHFLSDRGNRPLQSINCSAIPDNLLESELFGYEKGAFTGANSVKLGIVEDAHGSTLFLDEIGDMNLSTQAKMLRVIQEKELRHLGSTSTIKVDIRIVSATNKNLEEAIKNGSFREDLFYRLNIIPITIPPLRARQEDVPALIAFFLNRRDATKTVHKDALDYLCHYQWPGNVRELEAVMERLIILSAHDVITIEDLPVEIRNPKAELIESFEIPNSGMVFEEFEKKLLLQALTKSNGMMSEAAKLMGMTYRTFQYRATKFGIISQD